MSTVEDVCFNFFQFFMSLSDLIKQSEDSLPGYLCRSLAERPYLCLSASTEEETYRRDLQKNE